MDNARYRDRVQTVLGQLNFDNVMPRFNQSILADYAISGDNTLKFFIGCSFISDPISFRIDGKEITYTSEQAKLLGRIPGLIIGKGWRTDERGARPGLENWKKLCIVLPEPDYYSIFGNYPLLSLEDYIVPDKLNPKLYWKKIWVMIRDKRKRGRTWMGKLRGIRIYAKGNCVIFALEDFVNHLEHSLVSVEQ